MHHSPKPGNVVGVHHPVSVHIQPRTVDEVLAAVALARRDGEKLYPISTGLNWGYGSDSPVVAGCKLLDLRRMNRILNADEISVDNPVAIIEPGVTQGQLYEFLQRHCPDLTFNVSGSGRDTSIIGNALDRGVGYFSPRKNDLFGLEVVTGTGVKCCEPASDDWAIDHRLQVAILSVLGRFWMGFFSRVTWGSSQVPVFALCHGAQRRSLCHWPCVERPTCPFSSMSWLASSVMAC